MSQQQQQTKIKPIMPKPIIDKNAPGMDSPAYSKTGKGYGDHPKKVSSKKSAKKAPMKKVAKKKSTRTPSYAAVQKSVAKTMGH